MPIPDALNRLARDRWPFAALLAWSGLWTAWILSGHGHAWAMSEVVHWKAHILAQPLALSWEYFRQAFDLPAFEFTSRTTRPLSHLFEMLDTPFRAWLWKTLIPHPSLSLTWPFTLVLTPFFAYRLFLNLGVRRDHALAAAALVLCNPGTLSVAVMLFRPGKPLGLCALLGLGWWASALNLRLTRRPALRLPEHLAPHLPAHVAEHVTTQAAGRDRRPGLPSVLALFTAVYLSFFLDETSILAFPVLLLLFPRLVTAFRTGTAVFWSLPLAYWATATHLLPALTALAGYPRPELAGYDRFQQFTRLLLLGEPLEHYAALARDLGANALIAVRDTFGLMNPGLTGSWYFTGLLLLGGGSAGVILVQAARALPTLRTGNAAPDQPPAPLSALDSAPEGGQLRTDPALVPRSLALALLLLAAHGFLLHLVANQVWGVYYYGIFCPPFLILALFLLLERIRAPRGAVLTLSLGLVLANQFIFPATNAAYKRLHYYPYDPLVLSRVFTNEINRFTMPRAAEESMDLGAKAEALRQTMADRRFGLVMLPAEMRHLLFELGVFPSLPKSLCNTRHMRYFLLRSGSGVECVCMDGPLADRVLADTALSVTRAAALSAGGPGDGTRLAGLWWDRGPFFMTLTEKGEATVTDRSGRITPVRIQGREVLPPPGMPRGQASPDLSAIRWSDGAAWVRMDLPEGAAMGRKN